ncbi:dienelactone hydrolase family protein [Desulfovibrio sp. OttesenSCG-928-C14]|nr:dienelactone hydrolase family protein [Desulfovibrio sp. OttesenSCG-928-C14]
MGEKEPSFMVGFRTYGLEARDGTLMSLHVWYPSARPSRGSYSTKQGGWTLKAERNVKVAEALFPIIVFSHDAAGYALFNHDVCSALAEAGFVVVAPTHGEDNLNSAPAMLSAASCYHRPLELIESLHFIATHADFKQRVDATQVGVLGAGLGALSAMQLAGVDLDASGAETYCAAMEERDQSFCNSWTRSRMRKMQGDLEEIRGRLGPDSFTPAFSGLKAVGLLAPGGLFMLDKKSLSALQIPVAAVFAEQDAVYLPALDPDDVEYFFPRPLYESVSAMVLKGVDHYGAYAAAPADLRKTLPDLVSLSPKESLEKGLKLRDAFLVNFFRSSLGAPQPKR